WTWTLPAARSKNKRARVTPLVGIAREVVEARLSMKNAGPLFTSATGSILTAAHVGHYLLARSLPIGKFTTHDLRRTVATQLTKRAIPLEVGAAVIGNEAGGRETRTLIRHYVRTDLLDRKKLALKAWERRLLEIVEGKSLTANVTYLAEGRA